MSTDTRSDRREHPVVARAREKRAADAQLRVADAITAFAGSMTFVYLHVVLFAGWMKESERRVLGRESRLPDDPAAGGREAAHSLKEEGR